MPTTEQPEETTSTSKETSEEKTTKVNATWRKTGLYGAFPHPLLGPGVNGDGCEVLVRFQRPRKQGSLDEVYGSPTV